MQQAERAWGIDWTGTHCCALPSPDALADQVCLRLCIAPLEARLEMSALRFKLRVEQSPNDRLHGMRPYSRRAAQKGGGRSVVPTERRESPRAALDGGGTAQP